MSLTNHTGVPEVLFTSPPRVTVKFNLGLDKTLTLPFEIETQTIRLREKLSSVLKVPLEDLKLSHDSKFITDDQTLANFAASSCGSIVINLSTNHYVDFSQLFNQMYGDLPVKDVISVIVEMGVDNKKLEKDVQTMPKKISKLGETPAIAITQTPVSGLHVIEPLNKYMTARKYTSTKELEEKVSLLQKKCRQCLLRTKLNSHKREVQKAVEIMNSQEIEYVSKVKHHEIIPVKKDNNGHIKQVTPKCFSGIIKTFSNKFLLTKEIKHLMSLEKDRKETMEILKKEKNLNTVKKFCQPYTWTGKSGCSLSMETEYHREFLKWQDVYCKFISSELSNGERRQLIILMKNMLEPIGGSDCMKFQELLVRQLDLIDAGVRSEHLLTLQKITEKYFLVFLEDYAQKCFSKLNVEQVQKVKNWIYTCKNCRRAKPESSFQVNSRITIVTTCKSCFYVENMNRCRVDYSIYRQILQSLRREEEKCLCLYSPAFMLQEEDIYYIVNIIWHSKSILSENKEIANLRLCRFDNAIQWSPWNCFLITHREMLAHILVDNPLEVYGAWLIEKVRTKHLMARLHFLHLYKKGLKPSLNKTWLTTMDPDNDKNMS